jgi:hypothetical protein
MGCDRDVERQSPVDWFESSSHVAFALDASFAITAVNQAYRDSATEHASAEFLPRWGVGCSIISAIAPPLRGFYEELFRRGFADDPIQHTYQCHTAVRYREFILRTTRLSSESLVVEHALLTDRALPASTLSDEDIRGGYEQAGAIVQCCHCRKVKQADARRWDWIARLIERPWPRTSLALCEACQGHYSQ